MIFYVEFGCEHVCMGNGVKMNLVRGIDLLFQYSTRSRAYTAKSRYIPRWIVQLHSRYAPAAHETHSNANCVCVGRWVINILSFSGTNQHNIGDY
jgi:hypothetical protein